MKYEISLFALTLFMTATANSMPWGKQATQDEKIDVYIPYDIKYIPIEVPDKYLSKSSPIASNKEDISVTPLKDDVADPEQHLNHNFLLLPVNEQFLFDKTKTSASEVVAPKPSKVIEEVNEDSNGTSMENYSRSKRQAPGGFFYYRPVFRYSRTNADRRRINRPSRQHAMVGYLSDRDLFPTVA